MTRIERLARGAHTPAALRWLARLALRAGTHDLARAASAMAFDFFLGLVPLLAAMGYVISALGNTRWVERLAKPLLEGAPGQAAAVAREQFFRYAHHGAIAPLGMVGFLWLASGGAHTAVVTLRVIAGAPARPWWRSRAIGVAFVLLAVALATVTTMALVLVARSSTLGVLRPHHALATGVVTALAGLGVIALATATLYRLTHGSHRSPVWPGTGVSVLGFVAVTWGFTLYIDTLGRFSAYYGGLAAVAMLLGWIWLSSTCLLLGAEVNALVGERDGG